MVRRDEVVRKLREHWTEIEAHGAASLTLFGLVARDQATETSDVDLLVEFDRPTGYLGLLTLKHYLEDTLGCAVDLGTLPSLPEAMQAAVLEDAIRVG